MPCNDAEINVLIKGCNVHLVYRNENNGKRSIFVDNKQYDTQYNELLRTQTAFIPNSLIHNDLEILVTD